MRKIEEFLRNAEEAERLARNARIEEERDAYVKIAESWRALAQTRRALNKPPTGSI